MQGGAFGYGPKVEYGSNQHSFSWALSTLAAIAQLWPNKHSSSWAFDICTPRFKDAQFG